MKKSIVKSFWGRKAIGAIFIAVIACMVACGDDSSSSIGLNEGLGVESSSSAERGVSSSSGETPKSYAEAKVVASGTYDCSKYSCFTTEYLNQEFLEAGKYGEILDERDGQVYKSVQIGDQIWMAQNLNYYDDSNMSLNGKSWCYNDSSYYCQKYGRLYSWAAAMDSVTTGCGYGKNCGLASASNAPLVQGICPTGWHLPTKYECDTLFTAVGGEFTAGKVLKLQGGWYSNGNGTDTYGFSALPTGSRSFDGQFIQDGNSANFWSSTEYLNSRAYYMHLFFHNENAYLNNSVKHDGSSVRCLKD